MQNKANNAERVESGLLHDDDDDNGDEDMRVHMTLYNTYNKIIVQGFRAAV